MEWVGVVLLFLPSVIGLMKGLKNHIKDMVYLLLPKSNAGYRVVNSVTSDS
jgi:hypothetical protein